MQRTTLPQEAQRGAAENPRWPWQRLQVLSTQADLSFQAGLAYKTLAASQGRHLQKQMSSLVAPATLVGASAGLGVLADSLLGRSSGQRGKGSDIPAKVTARQEQLIEEHLAPILRSMRKELEEANASSGEGDGSIYQQAVAVVTSIATSVLARWVYANVVEESVVDPSSS